MNDPRYLTQSAFIGLAALLYLVPARSSDAADAAAKPDVTKVLTKVHANNQKEIEVGKLGEKTAKSKEVIALARMLVKDHTAADRKVMAFAKKHKLDLGRSTGPAALNKKDADHLAAMAKTEPFDAHFVQMVLEDHQRDIAELSEARSTTDDADLKELIGRLLPALEKHQKAAQKLVDKAKL